ncbi:MAG: TlpA family protein disulfide reductase [Puniceicoccaceae bacterium]|nr:MAG: TlpA family protein disulfide reductase [Puniceicoccaceae bacterium]
MRRFVGIVLAFATTLCAIARPDPAALLAELREARDTQRQANPIAAYADIDATIAAQASDYLAGLNPAELPLTEAADWAALYTLAGDHAAARELLGRRLAADPAGVEFSTRLDFLLASARLRDGETLYRELMRMPIPAGRAATLGSHFGGSFHHSVMNARGPEACLAIIARIREAMPEGPFENDEVRKSHGWALRQLAATEAFYLAAIDRRAEAVAVLDHALETLDADIFRRDGLQGDRQRYLLLDQPAPDLIVDRVHGEFTGWEDLRGKVVLLEFTAHWCHACHKAIPGLLALEAELADRDFVIVAVTTYYGFFGSQGQRTRDLPRETEFALMPAMLEQQGVTWPMVYTERESLRAYGVTGIPQFMVIDQQGIIRTLDTGYSEDKMDRLREVIVGLLDKH